MKLLARVFSSRTSLSALGVAAAGLLLLEINVLSARHYTRVDFSTGTRFSLSQATEELLARQQEPVTITVALSSGDPLLGELRQTLDAYRAKSSRLQLRFVDPDRDAAQFLALGREYALTTEQNRAGVTVADAAVIVASGRRHRFVRSTSLVSYDQEGRRTPRIEAALTDALARLEESQRTVACFVTGHGEKSIDDEAETGLSDLRRRLDFANIEARRAPLDVPDPGRALSDCDSILLVGPARPVPRDHEDALLKRAAAGANLGFFLDPLVGTEGRLEESGLSRLLAAAGMRLPGGFVLETAAEQRLGQGIGEVFLAEPKPHPVTLGLSTDTARLDARPVVIAAQPVEALSDSAALPLLVTSDKGLVLNDLSRLDQRLDTSATAQRWVALASRQAALPPNNALEQESPSERESRVLLVGSTSLIDNRAFREPSLHGNRRFAESALSWLTARPSVVSVPNRSSLPAGLTLTEDSLTSLLRYVLVYMPVTAALLGTFVLLRRRRKQVRPQRSVPPLSPQEPT